MNESHHTYIRFPTFIRLYLSGILLPTYRIYDDTILDTGSFNVETISHP